MKRLRFWVWAFMAIAVLGLFTALGRFYREHNPELPYNVAQKESKDPMQALRHVVINEQDLWIPTPYFTARIPATSNQQDVSVTVLYPDFSPLKETPQSLWEKGEWIKNVKILISDARLKKNTSEFYHSMSKSYGATSLHGDEYGLKHYSQPEGVGNDGKEFWVEGNAADPTSFIMCGKKVSDISVPQCSLHMEDSGLNYWISFNKDQLLPHWRDIKTKSFLLIQSFKDKPDSSISP